ISLIGGAQPCQVFWRVTSSATIATSTTMVGNIMANISIALQTGATLNGRALARTGAVTLDDNRIIQASGCGYTAPGFVGPPAGTVLPATLGVPSDLLTEVPWLLVIGLGSGAAALAMVVNSRRRRRRNG
ncbi:MAG TPA: ice-binding family protein, partial [Candidatus Dormibacteraeota bacterium]